MQLDPKHKDFNLFEYPFSKEIWQKKYSNNGKDDNILVTFNRVATSIASIETPSNCAEIGGKFFDAMQQGILVPAGRILAGAGTGNRVTLVNCFVNDTVHDSMEGIMNALADTALTMQQGGGTGTDFSTLRPENALLKRTASAASGPLPFMDTWDAMCGTIKSAGSRRGAMMGTITDNHPDLLRFIEAKHTQSALRNFNMSILISDAFMAAVKEDASWALTFPKPPIWVNDRPKDMIEYDFKDNNGIQHYCYSVHEARFIWNKIMESTFEYAEPGVIFIDRINSMNNLNYLETISCTNPCGEQPLPPYGACNLSSINMARLILNPFTSKARLDKIAFKEAVTLGMRFVDNVIDVTAYPLEQQKAEQEYKRRTGLGITGLADALIMLGIEYGDSRCLSFLDELGDTFCNYAYQASAKLAKVRGSFPGFELDEIMKRPFIKDILDRKTQKLIEEYGLRNGVLLTIAPVGTGSIAFGNISSALEPNFAFAYDRKVLEDDGSYSTHEVESFIKRFAKHCGVPSEGPAWVTANDLEVTAHINVQATLQKYIDASISKTVNCPVDITFEDFKAIYEKAYHLGCKGCTTYRPSEIRGSILSVKQTSKHEDDPISDYIAEARKADEPITRPNKLQGTTYKLRWPSMSSALYMTVNDIYPGKPFEVFFASKDTGHHEWMLALSLSLTSLFRLNKDTSFIIDEFKQIASSHDSAWLEGKHYGSLIAYIGKKLEDHINGEESIEPSGIIVIDESLEIKELQSKGAKCPECGQFSLINQAGCTNCTNCAYTKCG